MKDRADAARRIRTRSRRRAAGLLSLCFAAISSAEPATQRILPEHRPAVGQKRYLKIRTQTEKTTSVSFFPNLPVIREDREWWVVVDATKPESPPPFEITWLLDRVQATFRDGHHDVRYDSIRGQPPREANGLSPWVGRVIRFRTDSRGQRSAMTPAPATQPAAPRIGGQMMEPPTPAEWDRLLADVYESFIPTAPVAVGERWERVRTISANASGTVRGPVSYTLKSIEPKNGRPCARIDFAGTFELTVDPSQKRDDRETRLRAARYDGTLLFDLEAGEVVSLEQTQDVKIELIMTARQPATSRPTSGPASRATSQAEEKVTSYTFVTGELRKTRVESSRTAPVKPIIVAPSSAPAAPVANDTPKRVPPVAAPHPATQPTSQRAGYVAPPQRRQFRRGGAGQDDGARVDQNGAKWP